jgi:S-adenosylmethionine hydrolase
MASLITLLTDFGVDDPYVSEVKAVLLEEAGRSAEDDQDAGGGAPPPLLLDLCHTLPRGDVAAARWFLARVHARFPAGTVHLAVVDPGVGTSRPALAVSARGQHFVAPGNGLLAFLDGEAPTTIVRLRAGPPLLWRPSSEVSQTFHGRDLFAPAAARLAAGWPIARLGDAGSRADLHGDQPAWPDLDASSTATTGEAGVVGRIVWIDRFGNAITDIAQHGPSGPRLAAGATLEIQGQVVPGPRGTFAEGSDREPFWYWGSGSTLEIALRGGSAAVAFGWRRGLIVRWRSP